jgi:RND family efflux transporter MFP subunit
MNPEVSRGEPGISPAPPPAPAPRLRAVLIAISVLAVLAAALGIASRMRARTELKDVTRATAAPTVSVVQAEPGAPAQELILPASVQAFTDAPIYARTSGYLKWYADIGARVRKGQRLADIDSPEIEQQLQAARADLANARANEHLAKATADRYVELIKTDSASRLDLDNAVDGLAAKRAAADSAQSNVRRLEQMAAFQKIDAPFDGVITARNTDIGQLIDSGSSGGPARELFRISATDTMRVFVNVPQVHSRAAAPGVPVDVTFAERAGKRYRGKIARTASAIDPGTRTLLVEVDLDNAAGEILPGAFAEVHLQLASAAPTQLLPVSALMFRSEGVRVATVAPGNRAALVPVTLGRDFGTKVEVTSGLAPGALVIDSPPDSLIDGQEIRIARPATPAGEAK